MSIFLLFFFLRLMLYLLLMQLLDCQGKLVWLLLQLDQVTSCCILFVISCCCVRCRNKEENIAQERKYDITLVLQLFIDNVTLNISFCLHTGLTNTVTAIKNAQMAESPLLLMGGAAATLLKVKTLKRLFFI